MSETITLPKSGIVLERIEFVRGHPEFDYRGHLGGLFLRIYRDHKQRWAYSTLGGGYALYRTKDEAVAHLDADLLALRSALLPADALARALWATVLRERYGESDSWDDLPTCKKDAAMAVAHSVLAALVRP